MIEISNLTQEDIESIIWVIFFILFWSAMIIWSIIHNKKRKELKKWTQSSIKIKWIIKSVEYIRWVSLKTWLNTNQIEGRYITVEWIDPSTNKKIIYESEKYSYPSKYLKSLFSNFKKNKERREAYIHNKKLIWEIVDIIINEKNPKIYYIPEPKKEILDKNHNHIW